MRSHRATAFDLVMAGCAILLLGFAVYEVAGRSAKAEATAIAVASVPPKPVYGWQRAASETFELKPTEIRQIDFDKWPKKSRARLMVNADMPISVTLNTSDDCDRYSTVRTELICPLTRETTLTATDERKGADVALNGIAAWFTRSSKAAERAIAPNRVRIDIDVWLCIKNCS